MNRFKEMIEAVRKYGLLNTDREEKHKVENWKREFFGMASRCNIFVFSKSENAPLQHSGIGHTLEDFNFSSPFDCISIEMADLQCALSVSEEEQGRKGMDFYALMYDDIKDVAYLLLKHYPNSPGAVLRTSSKDIGDRAQLYLWTKSLVEKFVNRINAERVAVETVSQGITVNNMKGKPQYHEINKVIHVSASKKYFTNAVENNPGRKMEFSHRFSKRGHWRYHSPETIGKDRHGERNQRGRTWVKEHVVGDESLPLISKMRVV